MVLTRGSRRRHRLTRDRCRRQRTAAAARARAERRRRLKVSLHLRNVADIGIEPIDIPWPRDNGWFEGGGVCRRCGCTDFDCADCIERTGTPCHWVEPDLCSACTAEIGA